jgi:hypothetical protein
VTSQLKTNASTRTGHHRKASGGSPAHRPTITKRKTARHNAPAHLLAIHKSSGENKINMVYYETFLALRHRIETQFNEFAFPLFANEIYRLIGKATGSYSNAPKSSLTMGTNNGVGNRPPALTYIAGKHTEREKALYPNSSRDGKISSSIKNRVNPKKALLSYAEKVMTMSPAISDRHLELVIQAQFGIDWTKKYCSAIFEIFRMKRRTVQRAHLPQGVLNKKVSSSSSSSSNPSPPLRVAFLDNPNISTVNVMSILNSSVNLRVTSQLDRLVYIDENDQLQMADKHALDSQLITTGVPKSKWYTVTIEDLTDFQSGNLRVGLNESTGHLDWIFKSSQPHETLNTQFKVSREL